MHYAVCLADHLWEAIESEGSKVLFPPLPACREANRKARGKLSRLGLPFKSASAWPCTRTTFTGQRLSCSGGRRALITSTSRTKGSTRSCSQLTSISPRGSVLHGDKWIGI